MNVKITIIISFLSATIFLSAMDIINAQIEELREQRDIINEDVARDHGGNSTAAYKVASKYSTPRLDMEIAKLEKLKEKMKSKASKL